jgi:transposase-like protein
MEDDRSVYKLVNGALQVRDIETGELTGESGKWIRPIAVKEYSVPLGDHVCELVRQGNTYNSITDKMGLGSTQTIYRWRNKHPDFEEHLKAARRDRADYYHDQVMEVAQRDIIERDEVSALKLRTDLYKWGAEKANPQEYGAQTKITGDVESPLQIIVDTGIKREEDNGYIQGELAEEEDIPQDQTVDVSTSCSNNDEEEKGDGPDL